MKKFSILVLVIAFVGFGCTKKTENGTTDSTGAAVGNGQTAVPAQITPPAAGSTGPIRVIMGSSTVTFKGTFTGPKNQTVTIAGTNIGGNGINQKQFSGSNGTPWGPFTSSLSQGSLVSVTASIDSPGAYTTSASTPPTTSAHDITTYSDATAANTSNIHIDDTGIPTATTGAK